MRIRHVVPLVAAIAVAAAATVALASHKQIDPATVPVGFLTAHSAVNNVPTKALAKALRNGKTDVFLEHGRLDPGATTGFQTHPGPVFVVVQRGSLVYEDAARGRCRRQRFVVNRGFVDPPKHAHRFVGGTAGADYYVIALLPRRQGPDHLPARAPRGCSA